ncbi:MAG: PsbP-related protein [Candidatus Absconditabacterales bacterium]
MKKNLTFAAAVGLLFLFGCAKSLPTTIDTAVSTATGQQVDERQTYENKTNGFSLQYPRTRTFQENIYESAVIFFTPLSSGDTIKENVGIMKRALDKSYTLDDYYAITKPELVKLIPGFTEISNEKIQVNAIEAQKLIYKGTQGATKLQWEQIYLIKNKTVYIITYTATEATFNEFAQKVDEMVATLEIK